MGDEGRVGRDTVGCDGYRRAMFDAVFPSLMQVILPDLVVGC